MGPVAKHAVPLPSWLHRAVGLQAGSLTLDSWPHMRKGFTKYVKVAVWLRHLAYLLNDAVRAVADVVW